MEGKIHIVMGTSVYGTEQYYFRQLEKYWKETEIEVGEFITLGDKNLRGRIEELAGSNDTLLLVDIPLGEMRRFTGQGLYEDGESRWKLLPYLTVHPCTQLEKIRHLPPNTLILTQSKDGSDYLENYNEIKSEVLPMFGIEGKTILPWAERGIDVFFPGTYLDPEATLDMLEQNCPDVMRDLAKGMIHTLLRDGRITMAESLEAELKKKKAPFAKETITCYLEEYGAMILEYCRREFRKKLFTQLLTDGLEIKVCGQNWEIFKETLAKSVQGRLVIMEEIAHPQRVSDYMGNSKIVLNVSPNLRGGIHERVSSAMLNGAVCFTDGNAYMDERLVNHREVELYSLRNFHTLGKRIRELLRDEKKGQEIAQNARNYAEKNLTVAMFGNGLRSIMDRI